MRVYLFIITILSFLLLSCGTESTPVYTLTTSVTGEGTITPSGGEFEEGETVTLTGTPSQHWVFSNWSGDGSGTSSTVTITMNGNKNVVGNFVEREYTINYTINGNGTVEETVIQPKGEYTVGTVVQLTPVPDTGWKFVDWSGDVSSTDEVITVTVDGETNITVTFERMDFPLTITIEGEGEVEQEIISTPKTTEYPFETVVQLTSKPMDGWVFIQWSGDISGDNNPETIEVDEGKEVTSRFKSIEELLTIEVSGQGTVQIDQQPFEDNPSRRKVTLTPVPSEHWRFVEWGGDVSSTNEVLEVILDGEKSISVRFITPVFLGENGITIMCPDGEVGEIGIVDGVEYEVVDRELLLQRIEEGRGRLNRKVCVTLITDMRFLFDGLGFNEPIGEWDVSNVTNMSWMFSGSSFNQPIGNWNVSNVTDMSRMFSGSSFNQPIGNWNVSRVTSMNRMFQNSPFNQPIDQWDVSNVTNMSWMFRLSSFNQPIGNWNVRSLIDMSYMFQDSPFNQPIGNWNVSNVTTMREMFMNTPFNHPLRDWNTENVTDMSWMFSGSNFNQNISNWCVWRIGTEPHRFSSNSPLLPEYHPRWGTCPD